MTQVSIFNGHNVLLWTRLESSQLHPNGELPEGQLKDPHSKILTHLLVSRYILITALDGNIRNKGKYLLSVV